MNAKLLDEMGVSFITFLQVNQGYWFNGGVLSYLILIAGQAPRLLDD